MSRLSLLNWLWIACGTAATAIAVQRSAATVVVDEALFSVSLLWCATLLGMAICAQRPATQTLAIPFRSVEQLIAASVIFAFLQYPPAALARPLIDTELATIDRTLRFDWPAAFSWVLDHRLVLNLLRTVYMSLGLQGVLVCFVAWRRPDRTNVCLAANALTLTCCLAAFTMWPAGGAFVYYQPAGIASDYVDQFTAAHSGLVTTLALGQMKGIIQFPSYHAAAAVLFGYVFTSLGFWIAIPAILCEALLIISAVPIGGHHLADVLAGIAVAAISLVIAHSLARFGFGDRPRAIPDAKLALAQTTWPGAIRAHSLLTALTRRISA
jgi:membrane-associated phospholipid phosphatase